MLEIKDRNFFMEIVADAITQAKSNITDSKEVTRWVNAIGKGVRLLEDRGEFITMMDDHSLLIWSDSNEIYSANGVCQCKAYTTGIAQRGKPFPCKHRALARIVRLYFELQERPETPAAVLAEVEAENEAWHYLNELIEPEPTAEVPMEKAPYLKQGTGAKPFSVGGMRI